MIGSRKKNRKCVPLEKTPNARFTASYINKYIRAVNEFLSQHQINVERAINSKPQANALITRNASIRIPKLRPFSAGGLGMFVESPGEKAVGDLIRAKFVEYSFLEHPAPGFYEALADKVLAALTKPEIDFLYVHTKGPDEPSHDGDFLKKVQVIEMIDRHLFSALRTHLDFRETTTAVTCDHATLCATRIHSSDPVPLLLVGNQEPDGTSRFTEAQCLLGRLGRMKASDLVTVLRA